LIALSELIAIIPAHNQEKSFPALQAGKKSLQMAEFWFGLEARAAALALTLMIGLAGLSVLALAQS
jgi:hypothetical protein